MSDRTYCGALPPEGSRRTANCLRPPDHAGNHRNMDRDEWVDPTPLNTERES